MKKLKLWFALVVVTGDGVRRYFGEIINKLLSTLSMLTSKNYSLMCTKKLT